MDATPMYGMAGLVGLPEAGRLLGITRQGISWRVRTFHLPVVRVGKTHLVRLSDLMSMYGPDGHRVVGEEGDA